MRIYSKIFGAGRLNTFLVQRRVYLQEFIYFITKPLLTWLDCTAAYKVLKRKYMAYINIYSLEIFSQAKIYHKIKGSEMLMAGIGIQVNRIQTSVVKCKVELHQKVMCG